MKLLLRPDAEADVTAASDYYREASPELVDEFIDELDRLLTRLSEFPRSAQQVEGYPSVRRALMRRFPFAVFYIVDEDLLLVLRVIHTSRSPRDWPTK